MCMHNVFYTIECTFFSVGTTTHYGKPTFAYSSYMSVHHELLESIIITVQDYAVHKNLRLVTTYITYNIVY